MPSENNLKFLRLWWPLQNCGSLCRLKPMSNKLYHTLPTNYSAISEFLGIFPLTGEPANLAHCLVIHQPRQCPKYPTPHAPCSLFWEPVGPVLRTCINSLIHNTGPVLRQYCFSWYALNTCLVCECSQMSHFFPNNYICRLLKVKFKFLDKYKTAILGAC